MSWTSKADIDRWFTYQAPDPEAVGKLRAIRVKARELAEVILDNTPQCADQSAAFRKLREVVMVANAAVVLERAARETRDP